MLLFKYAFNLLKNSFRGVVKLAVNAYRVVLGSLFLVVSLPFAWAMNYDVVGEAIRKYAINVVLGVSMAISFFGTFFVQNFSDLDWSFNWFILNIFMFAGQSYLNAGSFKSFMKSLTD